MQSSMINIAKSEIGDTFSQPIIETYFIIVYIADLRQAGHSPQTPTGKI